MAKGNKTQIAVLDMDSHDGLLTWEEMVVIALAIIEASRLLRLRVQPPSS